MKEKEIIKTAENKAESSFNAAMKCLANTVIILLSAAALTRAAACDEFVTLVRPAKDAYMKQHRIYPIPESAKSLALRFMPRLWVHPQSWQPISFEDYLARARVVRNSDNRVVEEHPAWHDLTDLSAKEQCRLHLDAPPVAAANPAPVYIQVFWDEAPANPAEHWTYIKYNLAFDWSGLPAQISWLSRAGAFLTGGHPDRWHRLDIHVAAIMAFDETQRLRLLTLAQHNYQQTYLPGPDFPSAAGPHLAAAFRSNELYLDGGQTVPVYHRVVPFFRDVAYLIDPARKPILWARDITYGRNAGGREVSLHPVFIEPGYPLADFAGLLAPPRRFLGIYIGRDGPPGYNYYALPADIPLVDFAAMGFWRSGDQDLLHRLEPLITGRDPMHGAHWHKMAALMRGRLAESLNHHAASLP